MEGYARLSHTLGTLHRFGGLGASERRGFQLDWHIKEKKMKTNFHKTMMVIAIAATLAFLGCGGVSGNTYQAGGGALQIQFQSGGKANLSMAGQSTACAYVEDSKSVTVTCPGDPTPLVLTKGSNDTLNPPPGSFIGPLTKK
jgi:hypothetical protein